MKGRWGRSVASNKRWILQELREGRVAVHGSWKNVYAWRTLKSSGAVRLGRKGVELGDTFVPYPSGVRLCIRCHVPMVSTHAGHRFCLVCRKDTRELAGGLSEHRLWSV